MKTFKEIVYNRPDFEKEKERIRGYADKIRNASNCDEFMKLFMENEKAETDFEFMHRVAYIRNCINALDEFYQEEMNQFHMHQGEIALAKQEAAKAVFDSPYCNEIEKQFGKKPIREMEKDVKIASPDILEDLRAEANLGQEYGKTVASCSTEFRGEMCNFSGLMKHMQDTDREVRKEAFQAWAKMYEEISPELDRIYDEMIRVRIQKAEKLGFDNFIDYAYFVEGRDFTPETIKVFRKEVKEYLVPLCDKLFKEQAERLGIDKIEWFDEALTDPEGSAKPHGTEKEMLKWAQEMYRELSPETGEFFDFMMEHELFDLASKVGKRPGGFCNILAKEKAPFIFANFNGTSSDLYVLTHEAGHAFECYLACRKYPLSCMIWASTETDEIHSMSMEYFTYPWMEKFFGESADKYRVRHLSTSLQAVPYMVAVDEFQHRVFEEKLDAEGRRRVWKELENTYMPWRSYKGNEFLENGGFWMQKMHIFLNPFYYIDYALAQMGAFEFYERMCKDQKQAWKEYCKLCNFGGSMSYFETLEAAGLKNPFHEGVVKGISEFLVEKFDELEGK